MNTISHPNRDALQKALDIYWDTMHPFLVRIEINSVFASLVLKTREISGKK
jgi:hypothetical protein